MKFQEDIRPILPQNIACFLPRRWVTVLLPIMLQIDRLRASPRGARPGALASSEAPAK